VLLRATAPQRSTTEPSDAAEPSLAFAGWRITTLGMTLSRAARLVAVSLALALSGGCADGGAEPAMDAGSSGPRVMLGSGRAAFEVVDEDASIPLIKGIQGGFHVWTSFFAYGFTTDVVRMELSTRWGGLDDSLLEMAGNIGVHPATDPFGTPALLSLGWPAIVSNPACSNGQLLDIEITISDAATGASASDAIRWVIDVAEEDRSSDCGG
jgi:hypothetical protein